LLDAHPDQYHVDLRTMSSRRRILSSSLLLNGFGLNALASLLDIVW
jgi:hypothetical protein